MWSQRLFSGTSVCSLVLLRLPVRVPVSLPKTPSILILRRLRRLPAARICRTVSPRSKLTQAKRRALSTWSWRSSRPSSPAEQAGSVSGWILSALVGKWRVPSLALSVSRWRGGSTVLASGPWRRRPNAAIGGRRPAFARVVGIGLDPPARGLCGPRSGTRGRRESGQGREPDKLLGGKGVTIAWARERGGGEADCPKWGGLSKTWTMLSAWYIIAYLHSGPSGKPQDWTVLTQSIKTYGRFAGCDALRPETLEFRRKAPKVSRNGAFVGGAGYPPARCCSGSGAWSGGALPGFRAVGFRPGADLPLGCRGWRSLAEGFSPAGVG